MRKARAQFIGKIRSSSTQVALEFSGVDSNVSNGLAQPLGTFPKSGIPNADWGSHDQALAALDAAAKFPGAEWHPIVEKQLRTEIYHAARRWNEEIAVYRELLSKLPEVRPYMENLAAAYEAIGKPEDARIWRDNADPGRLLAGKQAPEFKITLLENGTELTLATALRGHKAVLLDFWYCACPPCRLSFSHLERLEKTLGRQGLTIVAVNFGDSEDDIVEFAREQMVSFSLAVGRRDEKDNPIFGTYHVSNFPTSFLINATGKVVWRGVGYSPELKKELEGALRKLGFNPIAQ
jgi:thiol-disulfide isomerase/thioredoxin